MKKIIVRIICAATVYSLFLLAWMGYLVSAHGWNGNSPGWIVVSVFVTLGITFSCMVASWFVR